MGILARELRIENIIGDGHFMFTVIGIKDGIIEGSVFGVFKMYDCQAYSLNDFNIEGIPLTEEWLLKFGFEALFSGAGYVKNHTEIGYNHKGFYIIASGLKIEYVHQLQNLYFALTGEELTITT